MRPAPALALALFLFPAAGVVFADTPPPAASAPDTDELYRMGRQLFEQYAPPEIKEQYEFPSKEQVDGFLARLDRALDADSLKDLAVYEPQARAVLALLRTMPDKAEYADWLAARLGELEEAKRISESAPPAPPSPVARPAIPATPGRTAPPPPAAPQIPYYERWLERERGRPAPARAAELMPRLRKAFAAEGVPPEIAWLAEAESSLNPSARSPSGARGLFQLKADAAHDLGLSTFFPDERTDPEKSAGAAARYLRGLRMKFGSWPLAFAAYNAGDGRVRRLLAARGAHDFSGIADGLPAGTRMYVPRVCALIAVRAGVPPGEIPAPR